MGTQISAVTLGVKDLARAKRFYEAIGGRVQKDLPSFVSNTYLLMQAVEEPEVDLAVV